MATVYKHLQPLEKRVINYAQQKVNELRKKIQEDQDRLELLNVIARDHGKFSEKNFAEKVWDEAREIGISLQADRYHYETWETILKAYNPCAACNGQGQTLEHISQDETRYHPCNVCHQTGVAPEPVAV